MANDHRNEQNNSPLDTIERTTKVEKKILYL